MPEVNLTIRLTKKEKSTLHKLALTENTTMTNYIKSKIFNVEESIKPNSTSQPTTTTNIQDILNNNQTNTYINTTTEIQSMINKLDKYFIPLMQTTILTYKYVDKILGDKIDPQLKQQITNDVMKRIKEIESV